MSVRKNSRAKFAAALLSATFASVWGVAHAEPARPADAFVDSIGINVHFLYSNYIDNFDVLMARMQEIGLRHYRDGILLDDPPFLQRLATAKGIGATGCFITRPTQFPALIEWAKSAAPYIDTLEGPNEPHNEPASSIYKGMSQPASLKPYQQDLYAAVRAEPALAHVLVATPGIDWFGGYTSLGDLGAWADVGNFHHWPPSTGEQQNGMNKGNSPTDGLYQGRNGAAGLLDAAHAIATNKPLIATETGFATTQLAATEDNGWDPGISDRAAQRYATRVFFELFNNGVKRTYLYELLDDWDTPQPVKKHQGMVLRDGTLKPHGTALKNIIALLTDPGPDFTAATLDYQLTSQASLVDDHDFKTPEVHHLLLEKRSGLFYLVLWNEAVSYDNLTEQDVVIADQEVQLALQTPIAMARTFRPLDGTTAIATFSNPTALTLQVPDHPLIVELTPSAVAVPGDGGAGGAVTGNGGMSTAGSGGVTSEVGGSAAGATASGGTAAPTSESPTAGGAATNGGSGAAATPSQDAGGCHCSLPRPRTSRESWWLLSLIAATCLRRRSAARTRENGTAS